MLAGSTSLTTTGFWFARLPVFTAVMLQVRRSPTAALTLSTVLLTRITGPGRFVVAVFGKSLTISVELVPTRLVMRELLLAGCV